MTAKSSIQPLQRTEKLQGIRSGLLHKGARMELIGIQHLSYQCTKATRRRLLKAMGLKPARLKWQSGF